MDGRIAGLETKWTYELDQPGAGYRIGHDPVAVCMGHYMTWHAAHLMNRSPVTIFEDDAEMIPDWRLRLEEACEFLPPDWDIVFLGSCCTSIESAELIGGGLYKVQSILCVHAYTVSQKGLPILLKHCQQIWAPVDIAVSVRALPHMKAYAILPRIAEQKGTQLDP
jgi:GR25 family glycosyltransferase involved in LPS biosynthesis